MSAGCSQFLFLSPFFQILRHITITSSSAGVLLAASSGSVGFLGGISFLVSADVVILDDVVAGSVGDDTVGLVVVIVG